MSTDYWPVAFLHEDGAHLWKVGSAVPWPPQELYTHLPVDYRWVVCKQSQEYWVIDLREVRRQKVRIGARMDAASIFDYPDPLPHHTFREYETALAAMQMMNQSKGD